MWHLVLKRLFVCTVLFVLELNLHKIQSKQDYALSNFQLKQLRHKRHILSLQQILFEAKQLSLFIFYSQSHPKTTILSLHVRKLRLQTDAKFLLLTSK